MRADVYKHGKECVMGMERLWGDNSNSTKLSDGRWVNKDDEKAINQDKENQMGTQLLNSTATANDRSTEQYNLWKQNYLPVENNLRTATYEANNNMGQVDQGTFDRAKAQNFAGLSSGFGNASRDFSRDMARRGLQGSGLEVRGLTDLANNKMQAQYAANANSYGQAVQAGDAYRQQKTSNLSSLAQVGRGLQSQSQNYLGQIGNQSVQGASLFGQRAGSIENRGWELGGAALGAGAQAAGSLGAASILAASDKRLKKNIQKVGKHKGLNVYTWDWNEIGEKVVKDKYYIGFIAQEVEKLYPQYVVQMDNGYMAVNYAELLKG